MPGSLNALRKKVAISMRILAMLGCVRDIMGHVSARIPGADEMFIRCRGGNETGLIYTDIRQIRRLDFDGKGRRPGDGYMTPVELPIHGEIYKARPEVQAIVHAHPHASVICTIAGLKLRPIFGAFDGPTIVVAAHGVPTYPRSILINRPDLAADLIEVMGERDCCLMKGHGITTVGPSVESATLLALRVESLARTTLEIARLGRDVPDIPQEDMQALGFLVEGGLKAVVPKGDEWIWAHYVRLLEDGVGVPKESRPR